MMYVWIYPFTCNGNREACMILSIKLHTLEVTSSSMTLRVLNLVQLRNWRLLGSSLKRSLVKLSWRISCMQFGTLLYPITVLSDLASCRYCIPMDSPHPILPAGLEFFNKGTGKGKSYWIHISSCWFWRDYSPLTIVQCYLFSIGWIAKKSAKYQLTVYWPVNMSFAVPSAVIFTKFDGQIASEFVNLTDPKDEDKWERARKIAEITFQKVYLPKFLDAKYPPKTYVRLEGENDQHFFLKIGSNVIS